MENTNINEEPFIALWSAPFFEALTLEQSTEILAWIKSNGESRVGLMLQSIGAGFDDSIQLPMSDRVSERLWGYLLENSRLVDLSAKEIDRQESFISEFMARSGKKKINEDKIRSAVIGSGKSLSSQALTTSFNVALLVSLAFKNNYGWVDWYIESNRKRTNFNTPTLRMTGVSGSYMDFVSSIRVCLLSALERPPAKKNPLKDHTDYYCGKMTEIANYNGWRV